MKSSEIEVGAEYAIGSKYDVKSATCRRGVVQKILPHGKVSVLLDAPYWSPNDRPRLAEVHTSQVAHTWAEELKHKAARAEITEQLASERAHVLELIGALRAALPGRFGELDLSSAEYIGRGPCLVVTRHAAAQILAQLTRDKE